MSGISYKAVKSYFCSVSFNENPKELVRNS